jgi:hypothetical protein
VTCLRECPAEQARLPSLLYKERKSLEDHFQDVADMSKKNVLYPMTLRQPMWIVTDRNSAR